MSWISSHLAALRAAEPPEAIRLLLTFIHNELSAGLGQTSPTGVGSDLLAAADEVIPAVLEPASPAQEGSAADFISTAGETAPPAASFAGAAESSPADSSTAPPADGAAVGAGKED